MTKEPVIACVTWKHQLKSWANTYQHHFARASRVRSEHNATLFALCLAKETGETMADLAHRLRESDEIRFVRIAPRELDSDNLASAFKAIRDATAKFIGFSDAPEGGIEWTYRQEKSAAKHYAVQVWFLRKVKNGS